MLAARASSHFCGSFKRIMMKIQSNAGVAPIQKRYFHDSAGFIPDSDIAQSPAVTFPTAESDWSSPSAFGLAKSGSASATKATESPNTPPTPNPVTKR